ncbi:hypothetical protein, partial [Ochrobactrum sp. SFR4]
KLDLLVNAVNLFGDGDNAEQAGEADAKQPAAEVEKARGSRVKSGGKAANADKSDIAEFSFSLNGQSGALMLSVAGSSKGTLTG